MEISSRTQVILVNTGGIKGHVLVHQVLTGRFYATQVVLSGIEWTNLVS